MVAWLRWPRFLVLAVLVSCGPAAPRVAEVPRVPVSPPVRTFADLRPTAEETATVLRLKSGTRLDWVTDLQWALLNKLDYIFNY